MLLLVDDVFADADRVYAHAVTREYGVMTGPDGARYEGMSFDVPDWLAAALYGRIHDLVGPVEPYTMFFRLSVLGCNPPHWAHTDTKLCDAMAIVYLSRNPTPGSGTAVVAHVGGLDRHPETEDEYATWRRDTNDQSRWLVRDFAPMKFNRMALVPSRLLHASLPQEGFGTGPGDGRLVLVTFFKEIRR